MLRGTDVIAVSEQRLEVELIWSASTIIGESLVAFVHVDGPDGLVGQSDSIPGQGYWPTEYWPVNVMVGDRHVIELITNYESASHEIKVGLYEEGSRTRVPVFDVHGLEVGDVWTIGQ